MITLECSVDKLRIDIRNRLLQLKFRARYLQRSVTSVARLLLDVSLGVTLFKT